MEMKWIMTLNLHIYKLKKKKQICLKTVYDNLLFTDKEVTLFFWQVKQMKWHLPSCCV